MAKMKKNRENFGQLSKLYTVKDVVLGAQW